jgi:hypothetical protein
MNTVENSVTALDHKLAFQVNLIDSMLAKLRSLFTVATCREHISLFRAVGHAGTVLAGVLGLVFSIVAAIKSDSFALFLFGFGWLVAMLIIDYVSRRFDQTADVLVRSTRSYLSSTIYVDALALILLVTSVALFVTALYWAIKNSAIFFFVKTGALSVWMFYVGLVSLHAASMLNIEFKQGLKAEEEGVGLLEFSAKGCLLAVPFYFGSGILFGLIHIVWSMIKATKETSFFASAISDTAPYFFTMAFIASMPFLACLAFLILYAFLAAVKSLTRMASMLDRDAT